MRIYMQSITDVKYNIQRNGTVGSFDAAHVGAADIDTFCKLQLGKTALLTVIGYVKTKKPKIFMMLNLHNTTPSL